MNNNILPVGQKYYSKIIFKGKIQYNPLNVISITIKEWVFEILPKVELILKYDPNVFEQFPIEDNDIFNIYISTSPDSPDIFKIDCMVHDYKISVLGDDRTNIIQITAILNCKNMFISKTKCYSKQNTFQVLSELANDVGLKIINPCDTRPADRQNYYQLNQNNYDFIKHILKRAYIHDDALFFYANHNGEFIYTSFNKERDKKKSTVAKFSIENYSNSLDDELNKTIWYNSYEIINLAGTVNKESNYGVTNTYYDLSKEIIVEYSKINPMGDLSFVDNAYKDKPVFNYYGGIFNNKNMYSEKYFESYIRNYFVKNNLLGLSLQINVNGQASVNLFDLIILDINSKISTGVNSIWSGYYLVTGIIYFISQNGIFQKRLFLSRNGMGKPDQPTFKHRNF